MSLLLFKDFDPHAVIWVSSEHPRDWNDDMNTLNISYCNTIIMSSFSKTKFVDFSVSLRPLLVGIFALQWVMSKDLVWDDRKVFLKTAKLMLKILHHVFNRKYKEQVKKTND